MNIYNILYTMDIKDLTLQGIISFNGLTNNALKLHPDQNHILYPMGSKIAIKNIESGSQQFLTGHTNLISTLCVSPCGKFVASGQINHLGFKAPVIIWNYNTREMMAKHEIHKVKVEDICFSSQSNYVISLGGKDDGYILVWDIKNKHPVGGAIASTDISGNTFKLMNTNLRDQCFVSGGENIIKLWRIDSTSRKLNGFEIKMGKIKRKINTIIIDLKDEFTYCGTSTGDIIKARLNFGKDLECSEPIHPPVMIDCYCKISKDPKKRKNEIGDLYEGGVNTLLLFHDNLIVGAGNGNLELIDIKDESSSTKKSSANKRPIVKSPNKPIIKTIMHCNVFSSVTSTVMIKNEYILVGTIACEIYRVDLSNFALTLLITCHTSAVYDVAFSSNYSEVFATGSKNDIRLWQLETQKELLRITIPNFVCYSLCISYDGSMIVSAWNDGSIKAFTPQSGRLIFSIHKAHLKAVTAVVIVKSGEKIISGGCDAQVRLWSIKPDVQRLIAVLIEHAGPITHLDLSFDDLYVVSSSADGTCILWDIEKQGRKQVLMAKTMFTSAKFALNDAQILTCGSDRKIAYWETLDGSLVRELEGSSSDSLNCIDVTANSQNFVSGASDFVVKFWDYNLGEVTHIGLGHAAMITACKFSPDGKNIVTVSADGTIMIWQCPVNLNNIEIEDGVASVRSVSNKSEIISNRSVKSMSKNENVDLTLQANETVRSIHKGDQTSVPCNCDPSQPNQNVCSPKKNSKIVVKDNEFLNSKESTRSNSGETKK